MIYATKIINSSDGKIRCYEDIHGHTQFFLDVGQELTIQTSDKKELWSPYTQVTFLEKEQVKVKKRPKWTSPYEGEDWVLKLHNQFGLPWEIYDVPLTGKIYLPKNVVVYVQCDPRSYVAKFKEVLYAEPFYVRQMLASSPGMVTVVKRDNLQHVLRSKAELAKLRQTREFLKDKPLERDKDMRE